MQGTTEIIQMVIASSMFKWTIGTIVTTLTGWALASIRSTNKKIRNAPTKDDLAKLKDEAYKYTDARITLHEKDHKPILQAIGELKIDNERIESKLDKLILIMVEKK